MPKITSGNSVTVSIPAGSVISLAGNGGLLRYEYPSGTVIYEGVGANQFFGPYGSTANATITSLFGSVDYAVTVPPLPVVPFSPAGVAITGVSIDGVTIGATTRGPVSATTMAASGQITSTVATGTAPLVVSSTTPVENLTASNVVTNANLTGPITSVGNATAVAAQTGTGSTFVMSASPTLVTPNIGAATASSLTATATVTAGGQIHGAIVNTAVSDTAGTTLSAASMVGGVITRSGPTAAYTDTTATASAIVAAITNAQVGTSFDLTIINTVAFAQTIAAGAGVTLAGTTALAASSARRFVGTITNVATPAVTLLGVHAGTL